MHLTEDNTTLRGHGSVYYFAPLQGSVVRVLFDAGGDPVRQETIIAKVGSDGERIRDLFKGDRYPGGIHPAWGAIIQQAKGIKGAFLIPLENPVAPPVGPQRVCEDSSIDNDGPWPSENVKEDAMSDPEKESGSGYLAREVEEFIEYLFCRNMQALFACVVKCKILERLVPAKDLSSAYLERRPLVERIWNEFDVAQCSGAMLADLDEELNYIAEELFPSAEIEGDETLVGIAKYANLRIKLTADLLPYAAARAGELLGVEKRMAELSKSGGRPSPRETAP